QTQPLLGGARDQVFQHPDQLLDCVLALGVLLVGMPPKLELPDRGLGKVWLLSQVKLYYTGPDIGAADVDRQDRVVCFEYPVGCQICGTDQACLCGIVADRHKVDRHFVCLQEYGSATNGPLADAGCAETAAHDDALSIAPRLEL